MQRSELLAYYPANGRVDKEIEITNISSSSDENILTGVAVIPPSKVEKKVVIHRLASSTSDIEFRAIPAKCPHQGADVSGDQLKKDGNIYCSLHKRPICIFSEYNRAYHVEPRGNGFFIVNKAEQYK